MKQVRIAVLAAMVAGCSADAAAPTSTTVKVEVLAKPGGVVGQYAEPAPRIRLIDGKGHPLSRISVRFSSFGGSLEAAETMTDENGEASARWKLGTQATAHRLTVAVDHRTHDVVEFSPRADKAATISVYRFDQVVMPGEAVPPLLYVLDRFGNPVSGVDVMLKETAYSTPGALRVTTGSFGEATLPSTWSTAGIGRREFLAEVDGVEAAKLGVVILNPATVRSYVLFPPSQAETTLTLSEDGYFIREQRTLYSPQGRAAVLLRWVGRYVDGATMSFAGCSHEDTTGVTCSISTGRRSGPDIVFGQVRFRPLASPAAKARTYRQANSRYYPNQGGQLESWYVLRDDGTFTLKYSSPSDPAFEYRGWYTQTGDSITFEWDAWNIWQPWAATGTLRGDSLQVKYNIVMAMSDFEDALYLHETEVRANVVSDGSSKWENCAIDLADGTCDFVARAVNQGPSCATDVRGLTTMFSADGIALAYVPWALPDRTTIKPNESFTYRVPVFGSTMQSVSRTETVFQVKAVKC